MLATVALVLGTLLSGVALAESRTERLVRELGKGPLRVRLGAALLLGRLADKTAVGPLTQALTDPIPALRAACAASLGQLGAVEAADGLVSLLSDVEPVVRVEAARALGAIKAQGAISPLAKRLDDTDAKTREAAARALAGYRDEQVAAPLVDSLLKGETGPELSAVVKDYFVQMRGKIALESYVKALKDAQDKYERARAAKVLELLGDKRAVEALIVALADADPFVRMVAAQALRTLGDARAIGPLEALVDRERNDRVVRVAKSSLTVLRSQKQ